MRKEYGKALRDGFAREMRKRLPDFKPFKGKSDYLFPGERSFTSPADKDLNLWIVCTPDLRGHESFTVEVGWSTRDGFPELSMRPSCAPSTTRDEFRQDEAMTRLAYLTGDPEWWVIEETADPFSLEALMAQQRKLTAEEARQRVDPLLKEVFEKIETTAIPYLRERAEVRS